jgi:hypothetical protein
MATCEIVDRDLHVLVSPFNPSIVSQTNDNIIGSSLILRSFRFWTSRVQIADMKRAQILRDQLEPERRSPADWVRRQGWVGLGEAVQGLDRQHDHHGLGLRPW